RSTGTPEMDLPRDTVAALERYDWPGNIRELRNVVERAVLLSTSGVVMPSHLGLTSDETLDEPQAAPSSSEPMSRATSRPLPALGASDAPSDERDRIVATLWKNGGNQSITAKELGISRRTLLKKLDKYGIARPQKGRG